VLLGTAITANGVTVLMIVTGAAAGAALLLPGLLGAVLAAVLGQLQMLWACCDGEVARWRQTFSPTGFFLDKLGHTVAEAGIPLALGVRADGGLDSIGGWTTLGAVLSVLVLVNKSLNDAVHLARSASGLPRLQDRAEEAAPRAAGVRRLRSLARFVPFHRAFHSVELTLLAVRHARTLPSLPAALAVELAVSIASLQRPDLVEGIRAQVIDKDRNPHWQPARLDDVDVPALQARFATWVAAADERQFER